MANQKKPNKTTVRVATDIDKNLHRDIEIFLFEKYIRTKEKTTLKEFLTTLINEGFKKVKVVSKKK